MWEYNLNVYFVLSENVYMYCDEKNIYNIYMVSFNSDTSKWTCCQMYFVKIYVEIYSILCILLYIYIQFIISSTCIYIINDFL